MTDGGPLSALMAEHRRFDDLLLEHQEHLVDRRSGPARETFFRLADALRVHAAAEEAVVLPLYSRRVDPDRAGEARYFVAEHERLRRLLAEIEAWLAARQGLPWPAAEIVRLVEREKTLKEVLEHHDQREERWLYPGLERALAADEVSDLVRRFREKEEACRKEPAAVSAPAATAAAPIRAALVAAAWLAEVYDDVLAGRERPRDEADWAGARHRLRALEESVRAVPAPGALAGELAQMAALLDDVTPMSRFPARRAADVHGCWHLLHAAARAERERQVLRESALEAGDS